MYLRELKKSARARTIEVIDEDYEARRKTVVAAVTIKTAEYGEGYEVKVKRVDEAAGPVKVTVV